MFKFNGQPLLSYDYYNITSVNVVINVDFDDLGDGNHRFDIVGICCEWCLGVENTVVVVVVVEVGTVGEPVDVSVGISATNEVS